MNGDIGIALEAIHLKAKEHKKSWDYYDGRHPLVFSSAKLRQVFKRLDARFCLNWCSVIIDSAADRIRLNSLDVPGDSVLDARIRNMFVESELGLEADEIHRSTLVTGEAFLFVWKEDKDLPVECYSHDAGSCHVEYDPDHPLRKRFAARTWNSGDSQKLSLYYPDRLEHYAKYGSSSQWVLEEEGENPFGEVPVFHFRRERRGVTSELSSIFELQDAVNKLLNDLMICSEFGVFAQRYVVSNADVGILKNSPNEIWQIPAADRNEEGTQVGQFEPMALKNFLEPMADLAAAIAILSRTPRHYFMRQGGDPSGESLLAMEAPLVHKVNRYLDRFSPVWADVGRFLLKLDGFEVASNKVRPRFEPVQSIPPRLQAEIRESAVRAGVPLGVHLQRYEGWTDEEVQEVMNVGPAQV